MSNIIKIKRGLKANLANSGTNEGELKYTTDTNELFIYSNGENKLLYVNNNVFPNWKSSLEVFTNFIAPNNGYLLGNTGDRTQMEIASLYIDGKEVYRADVRASNYLFKFIIPIKKGSVVTYRGQYIYELHFYSVEA